MEISVIIPAYQCVGTLENTVDSILSSGLSDYEIVIVDDGSEDGTSALCDRLAEKHEQIRCVHQKNAGVSAARNRGVSEAKGDYVWFFDADDSVDKDALCRLEEVLAEDEPDMLTFGMSFDYYHNGKRYRRDEMLPPMEGLKNAAECSRRMLDLFYSNSLSSLWSRIIKRSAITQMDGWLREDMFLYEDLEFVLRVWKNCSSFYFLREPIYRYRQAEDEGNAGRRLKRVAHIPELLSKIEEALGEEPKKEKILLPLYLTLAREKIGASSKADIITVCRDFKTWIDERGLLTAIEHRKYPMMIYEEQISAILAKRAYGRGRHRAANWIKQNLGDFRKWRLLS